RGGGGEWGVGEGAGVGGVGGYLMTGGLGGLGLRVARWMVGRGARRLYLVGRSGVGEGAREAIGELEGLGARVEIFTGDVSDVERMRGVSEEAGGEARVGGSVGGGGQYAAANHFRGGLVSYRGGRGRRGLGVWGGPGGGGGMATEESQRWRGQMGVGTLSPEEGVEALGRLVGAGVAQATVAAVD